MQRLAFDPSEQRIEIDPRGERDEPRPQRFRFFTLRAVECSIRFPECRSSGRSLEPQRGRSREVHLTFVHFRRDGIDRVIGLFAVPNRPRVFGERKP